MFNYYDTGKPELQKLIIFENIFSVKSGKQELQITVIIPTYN